MRKLVHIFCISTVLVWNVAAQSGCPGCVVNVPSTLSADTIYLADAPSGRAGEYYQADISFRMPKTTTPVAATRPDIAPGITISKITITSVNGVPPGLNWQANQLEFDVSQQTDGCVRFCGTPLQPGVYDVEVAVTARIFVINQTTSFSFPIVIEPAVSTTAGFSIENSSGCGEVAAIFKNKISSNGRSGFFYNWNFGNGRTSTLENPFTQFYNQPGTYLVDYQAIVDTAGYFLTGVRVEEVNCSDLLNRPDLQVEIYSPSDSLLFKSAVFDNATLPLVINTNIRLQDSTYRLRVTDEDDIIGGKKDECGTANFTRRGNGTLQSMGFRSSITLVHPVDTVRSRDTVRVYAQPLDPVISGYNRTQLCKGDTVRLNTNYTNNIQWYRNNESVLNAKSQTIQASETGMYQVLYTSADGCRAFSPPVNLTFSALPNTPVFLNDRNYLTLFEPNKAPQNYQAQWFLEGVALQGTQSLVRCAAASGNYLLRVTDSSTGCSSSFSRTVAYDPAFAGCTTSTQERFDELVNGLTIFPNPTSGKLWLQFDLNENSGATVVVRNAIGMEICRQLYSNLLTNNQLELDLNNQPAGMYFVELQVQDGRKTVKVVKQ